jgi:hypothetical protein
MERCWSLADLLAVAASKLFADVLDHLPPPRDHFQRLGDVLAQSAQSRAAAAQASGRARLDHPLARQMVGEGLARRALAGEGHHIRRLGCGALGGNLILGGRTLKFLQPQFHLVNEPHTAFRVLAIELARQLLDLQSLVGDHGVIVGSLGLGNRQFRLDPCCPGALGKERRLQRSDILQQVFTGGGHAGIES